MDAMNEDSKLGQIIGAIIGLIVIGLLFGVPIIYGYINQDRYEEHIDICEEVAMEEYGLNDARCVGGIGFSNTFKGCRCWGTEETESSYIRDSLALVFTLKEKQ